MAKIDNKVNVIDPDPVPNGTPAKSGQEAGAPDAVAGAQKAKLAAASEDKAGGESGESKDDAVRVLVRHNLAQANYRRAGLALTKTDREERVSQGQLATLLADPNVIVTTSGGAVDQ